MKIDPHNPPKSFCILPWIHTSIDPNGGVRPCCIAQPINFNVDRITESTSLKEIFTVGEKYKIMRKSMLEGTLPPETCQRCIANEAARGFSYRTSSNETFKDEIKSIDFNEDGTTEFRQVYIDYRFTNKCNFKCITCGPLYSSLHATELKNTVGREVFRKHKIHNYGIDDESPLLEVDTDRMLEEFKEFAPTVKRIYFAGGEPLISDHHYDILNLFVESQQPIHLFYNTNFSELNYKNYDVISLWKKINGVVDLFASIDGIGPIGEAIRVGMKTDTYKKNIRAVLESGATNISMNYNITFGVTNILHIKDLLIWLEEQHNINGVYTPFRVAYNPIFHPEVYSFTAVSESKRQEIAGILKEHADEIEKLNLNGEGKSRADYMRENLIQWVENINLINLSDATKRSYTAKFESGKLDLALFPLIKDIL